MSRLLLAKQAICDTFPVARFSADGLLSVRDRSEDLVPVAIVTLNDDDEPTIQFGLRENFSFAEIEALAAYMLAIDPARPEGLFPDTRLTDPHNQS